MSKKRRHLGEILYKKGFVSKENLIKAIKKGKQTNRRLGDILIEAKLATEDQIYECLAKETHFHQQIVLRSMCCLLHS